MSYQGQTAERNPTPASLTEGGVNMNSRLREIRDRISKIADNIHGMSLKAAGEGKAEAPPTNSLRRNLDVGFNYIDQIEAELHRLELNL
jgi:hypothetical protein